MPNAEAMSGNSANPTRREPREFAMLVKRSSAEELKQLTQGEQRTAVLDEVFSWIPDGFRPHRATASGAVIHWQIGDRPDGAVDTYELKIENGVCVLSEVPGNDPRVTIAVGATDFLKIVTGNANPMMLFLRGRLRIKGDMSLGMKVPDLFETPKV
jgi:putative sterol carrier protein